MVAPPSIAPFENFRHDCPKCFRASWFVPETLHRWCKFTDSEYGKKYTANMYQPGGEVHDAWLKEPKASRSEKPPTHRDDDLYWESEPAFHLRRNELRDGPVGPLLNDPDINKNVAVLFASTCNLCMSPVTLRVEGKKEEFVKIMRSRVGASKAQTERELRYSDLDLITVALTKVRSTEASGWCNLELGELCAYLDSLSRAGVSSKSLLEVENMCLPLITQLLRLLELKAVISRNLRRYERIAQAGPLTRPFLKLYLRLTLGQTPEKLVERLDSIVKANQNNAFNSAEWRALPVNRKLKDDLTSEAGKIDPLIVRELKYLESLGLSGRLRKLAGAGIVHSELGVWAHELFPVKTRKVGALSAVIPIGSSDRKFEVAAFTRMLAHDGFEIPYNIEMSAAEHGEQFKVGSIRTVAKKG